MRIKKLTAEGVKGQDFAVDLGAVTVIGGPNASGKTAIADAITIALTGAVPSVGRSTSGIYHALAANGQARDGRLAVRADFDDGTVASVEMVKTGGKVSCEARIPIHASLHPALADPEAFFGMTGQERARAIFESSGSDAVNVNAVLGIVRGVEGDPVARRSIRDGVVNGLIAEIDKLMAETEPGARVKALSSRMGEWKTRATEARGEVKRLQLLVRSVTIDPNVKPVPPDMIVALEAEQDALKRKIWEAESLTKLGPEWEERRKVREDELARLRAKLDEAEKASEKKRSDLIPVPEVNADADLKVKEDVARLAEVRARLANLSGKLEASVAQRQKLGESDACPLCGSTSEIEQARERVDSEIERLDSECRTLSHREAELAGRVDDAADAERDRFAIIDHNASIQNDLAKLESEARELRNLINSRVADAEVDTKPNPTVESPEEIQKLKDRVSEVEDRIETLRAANDAWVAQENAITRRDADEAAMLEASCRASILTEGAKAVLEYVGTAGEKAFGRVLDVAARVTDGVLRSPLRWMDGGLGRFVAAGDESERGCKARVGAWIPWEAFSGTERAVALCAFSVALAMSSPFRLTIIDELGRLTAQMRVRLLENLGRMVAEGMIHQAVVIVATTDKADVSAMTGFAINGTGIDGVACFVSNGAVDCCLMRSVSKDPEKTEPEPETKPKRSRKVKA